MERPMARRDAMSEYGRRWMARVARVTAGIMEFELF